MEDGYRLIDYGININDVIQLMIRSNPHASNSTKENETKSEVSSVENNSSNHSDETLFDAICEYYEVELSICHQVLVY